MIWAVSLLTLNLSAQGLPPSHVIFAFGVSTTLAGRKPPLVTECSTSKLLC